MAKVLEKQIKMEEDLKTNTGFSEAAAGKVQAVDMNDEDMTLLNLKWSSVDQIRANAGNLASAELRPQLAQASSRSSRGVRTVLRRLPSLSPPHQGPSRVGFFI